MSRQFNTQNYTKPRFKKVYLNFTDNLGHYNFRGVVENNRGITLVSATPQDFYMAPEVAINYAYLGNIIHECNYDLQTEPLNNGKEHIFNLSKVSAIRVLNSTTSIHQVFDYAKAAFQICYRSNGWGGNNSQPTLIGLSPITKIKVRFAGSPFNPQISINTVYSDLLVNNSVSCNRLNWKEYESQDYAYSAPQNVTDYLRYESWGYPGVGFTANNFENMILSLFDNQTDPRQTIENQPTINVPIAAVQYISELGSVSNVSHPFDFKGSKFAPLAYFIEQDTNSSSQTYRKYRFTMIRSCENAFKVDGLFDGNYRELECKSLIRYSDDNSIDAMDESIYNTRRFDSYPETTKLISYQDSY